MFDDAISDLKSYKKLSPKIIELFLRGRKLSVSLFFYFTILYQSA